MNTIIIFLMIVVGALALAYAYLRVVRHYSPREGVDIIDTTVRNGLLKLKNALEVSQRRDVGFYSIPAVVLESYIRAVTEELVLCKSCKFSSWRYHSQDVLTLQMLFFGLNRSYTPDEAKQLLTSTLQEKLVEYFGSQAYPLVYWAKAERPVVTFWVAANLQGNMVIQQRLREDYYSDIPNQEELTDD